MKMGIVRESWSDIQLGVDQAMGSAVVMLIDDDVVIDIDLGFLPNGQVIGLGWQRQENRSFMAFKPAVA